MFVWNICQFRNVTANENSLWVLIGHLFDRRVDPHRVDSSDARLHLNLAVMDARFIIEEQSGQIDSRFSPVQPKVVTGK